jgi:hypothetical protein
VKLTRYRRTLIAAANIILIATILVACGQGSTTPATPPVPTPISVAAMQEQYGVQLLLLGTTAAGGLIDFRFKVTDPAKAAPIFAGENRTPGLVLTDGTILTTTNTTVEGSPQTGVVYYTLFANRQSMLKAGDVVTVQFGDVRTGPLTAQ